MANGVRRVRTGIDELDKLLFGDEHDRAPDDRVGGFSPGDVVLIRGEPGTGKTTLALQIAEFLHRTEPGSVIRYVTIEEPLHKENRRSGYAFCTDAFMKSIQWLGRSDIEKMIDKTLGQPLPERIASGLRLATTVAAEGSLPQSTAAEKMAAAHAASTVVNSTLQKILNWFIRADAKGGLPGHPRMFVIDSLGALMSLLTKAFPLEEPRLLFNEFCRFLREDSAMSGAGTRFGGRANGAKAGVEGAVPPIILIIGEHHFSGSDADRYFPESFFCDVEIVLRPEPIRVPRDSIDSSKIALGYHLAAVIENDAQHVETRSFCRVVKSRYSRNQSRRCAYDIESRRGIRFYETFPGDGKLMLFAENEQQRAAWGSFFKRDLIDSYPALRYELFTMAGMETVYESSRRLLQVPLRTDMFLSSLDSYWVLGYRDYHMKTRINENLRGRMKGDWPERLGAPPERSRSLASTWVCRLYPRFVNELVHLSMSQLDKTIQETTLNELLLRPRPARRGRKQAIERRMTRLNKAILKLKGEIASSRTRIESQYDWLSRRLFKTPVLTLLDTPGVLPESDLRETFLRPLPRSRMALFGQYNADLLPFLAREDMHQFYKGEDHWLCVPYDANIGVFVVRVDVLNRFRTTPGFKTRYGVAYGRLKNAELDVLRVAKANAELLARAAEGGDEDAIKAALEAQITECEAELKRGGDGFPSEEAGWLRERLSWDQVICASLAVGKPFGLETRSFDTLMATFLEMIWNCGGKMEVDGRYKIRDINGVIVPLVRAMHYFRALFSIADTPPDQTLDPTLFHDQPGGKRDYGEWLFGRYWYSALMDSLTATKARADADKDGKEASRMRTFIWKGDGTDVGDAPPGPSGMGAGGSFRASQAVAQANGQDLRRAHERPRIEIVEMPRGIPSLRRHFTCSGEWSFALLAGSENVALACDLISNLMGSLKVTERGRHGACLPTVNQFYKRHESELCIPNTIRADMDLPKMTFGELGRAYLGVSMGKVDDESREDASQKADEATAHPDKSEEEATSTGIFRQAIFDYRHCAREIFGELAKLTQAGSPEREANRVVKACVNMLRGIDDLGGRYIFIREPFRNDVATIAVQDFDGREDWSTKRAREPRLHVDGGPEGQIGKATSPLENLSPGGCCLKLPLALKPDSKVKVVIAGVLKEARIVKGTDQQTHLAFEKAFTYGEFGKLLDKFPP